MESKHKAFFAYPSSSMELAQTIRRTIENFNGRSAAYEIESWEQNDIGGLPLTEPIFAKILHGEFLAADITYLNENVAFEIGLAIGSKKRALLFASSTHVGDRSLANDIGIFDTLGYESYATSADLEKLLLGRDDFSPIDFGVSINRQQPVYIVEPAKQNDAHLMLVSRTKKARWRFRSFSPDEDVRLSAMDAIHHVAQSAGVITPLQSPTIAKSKEHNIRALFVAGISCALEIPTLIIHSTEYLAPLDVRDISKKYKHPNDIVDAIQEFSLEITDYQQQSPVSRAIRSTLLTGLSIGDPTAENEMTTLGEYYLSTDEFQRALRGEVNLVVGRKGSGKTALFVRLRDIKRRKRTNIIVDLKPEGYQLIKLKERVLDFLTVGAQQHLITAFWEYILLLEITYKVLEKDREVHLRDHRITEDYQKLSQIYGDTNLSMEGDFRERLLKLSDAVIHEFFKRFSLSDSKHPNSISITTNQVTEILYQHDIRSLYDSLVHYLRLKDEVWLLFDNIDKGWNLDGISTDDIFILRSLINASRKVEREFRSREIPFHSIVFVRDDVYSLLMHGSSDYGKEMRASLDWSDSDLLGEVLRRRIEVSFQFGDPAVSGSEWRQVCVSHYAGMPWLEFMAEHSLMRPRNLLKLFRYCLGYANNLQHERIETVDIEKGLQTYARDLVIEVDRELSDVFPEAKKLVYEFIEESAEFSHEELSTLIQCAGFDEGVAEKIIGFLLYYGVIGIRRVGNDPEYIYDVSYDVEMLNARIRKWGSSTKYVVHPSLWPALKVGSAKEA